MTAIGSQTIGDELTIQCNATIARGISSSVNLIMWKINDTGRKEIGDPFSNTSEVYTISSLNSTDNNTIYSCQAVINTSLSVNASDVANLTIRITGKKLYS